MMAKQTIDRDHSMHRGSSERTKVCPDCGHKMVKGQMSGGLSHNRSAWACTNFPTCRRVYIERTAEEDLAVQKILRLAQGNGKKK